MLELFKDINAFVIDQKLIKTVEIYPNTGQISGLPANPRYIEEAGLNDLKTSVREIPEYLMARPLIVIPYAGAYVVICGNMRLKACIAEHILEVPCIILNPDTPVERLKRYLVIDNVSYGKHDWDMLANEFEVEELTHWGLQLPYMGEEGGGDDETTLEPEKNYKFTLDCGTDQETFEKLRLKLVPIIEKFKGAVELKG